MKHCEKIIADGISLVSVDAKHFKTSEITINLAMPLSKDTASAYALVINMLSRKNSKYPSMAVLNKKLAYLYGAEISANVEKYGDNQVLSLGISCVDDRFSLDGKSIALECIDLLTSLLLEPKFDDNNNFYQEDIEAEKRLLIEQIEAENNEKRIYVLRQAESLMFENETYGTNKFGDVESIKALTSQQCKEAYNEIIETAKISIVVVGSTDAEKTASLICEKFADINRRYTGLKETEFVPVAEKVKEKTERIDVNQGKLIVGYRVNLKPEDKLAPAMRLFCDIFGGGPYSKLFANVREKMSLCYYCGARYTKLKSYIMIQCGCNEENMDKAVNEIEHQLDLIKNGDFDEEFKAAKISTKDVIKTFNDSPSLLNAWYSSQITQPTLKTPDEETAQIDKVTKEQIEQCSNLLSLDTIYKLSSPKEDK